MPNVTLSIYAHLVADTQRAAIEGLGERLERISAASAPGGSGIALAEQSSDSATEGQPNGNRRLSGREKRP
jgi:hypothetical protein